MRAVGCLLTVLFLGAASSAVAQERHLIDPMLPGSLNPKPLPPLKNPAAPSTPAKELFARKSTPFTGAPRSIGGNRLRQTARVRIDREGERIAARIKLPLDFRRAAEKSDPRQLGRAAQIVGNNDNLLRHLGDVGDLAAVLVLSTWYSVLRTMCKLRPSPKPPMQKKDATGYAACRVLGAGVRLRVASS